MSDADIGQPRLLDPLRYPCQCVTRHVPASKLNHQHHIVPLGWGGPDEPENIVPLCPTGHVNVHKLLDAWKKAGAKGSSSGQNPYLYAVAEQGWEGRPT